MIVDRDEARRLIEAGAQLVEVLPEHEYTEEHLPHALHLPLKRLDAGHAQALLDPSRPVVVYCLDALCDMSPRAAWRLERLGFGPVYDYAAGKVDWLAAGLPTVRADTSERRALDDADRDPPTRRPDDPVGDIAGLTEQSVVVVNERGIVLGRVNPDRLEAADSTPLEEVMEPGPATVRAHEPLAALLERMARRSVSEVLVTTPQGELLGVFHRPGETRRPARQ
jgi:rhodanese-related sulfurtransferase